MRSDPRRERATAGYTPLHYAAMNGNDEIFSAVLAKKPNLETKDGQGRTALFHALFPKS